MNQVRTKMIRAYGRKLQKYTTNIQNHKEKIEIHTQNKTFSIYSARLKSKKDSCNQQNKKVKNCIRALTRIRMVVFLYSSSRMELNKVLDSVMTNQIQLLKGEY